jgi:hypothetical protein
MTPDQLPTRAQNSQTRRLKWPRDKDGSGMSDFAKAISA